MEAISGSEQGALLLWGIQDITRAA